MFVWLHTSSPPQHIACVTETAFHDIGGCAPYLAAINDRRASKFAFLCVLEDGKGETSVHIFDNIARAEVYVDRNTDFNVITSTEDA